MEGLATRNLGRKGEAMKKLFIIESLVQPGKPYDPMLVLAHKGWGSIHHARFFDSHREAARHLADCICGRHYRIRTLKLLQVEGE